MVFLLVYSMILYFISVPTTVFPIFTILVIYKFSDKYDVEYKVLNILFYSVSSAFSFLLTLGLTPYILTPCLGVLPLGILNLFYIPTQYQLVSLIILFCAQLMIIIMLFFYRISVLNTRKSFLYTNSARAVIYFVFLIHFTLMVPFIMMKVENNPEVKSVCRQRIFFIADSNFFDDQTIIFQSVSSTFLSLFYIFIASSLCYLVTLIFFLFFYTRKVFCSLRSVMTPQINERHREITRILYIQTVPTLCTLILIVFLTVVILIFDISFLAMSYFIHLFMIFISLSGTLISCQHIYLRTEYRRGLLSLLGLSNSVSHTIYASSRRQSTISIINT